MAFRIRILQFLLLGAVLLVCPASPIKAFPEDAMQSVVSVLPVWPGQAQTIAGAAPGVAPEGSGVVIAPGRIATAWHVVEPATRIDIRLWDGRILPSTLIAHDAASDIAILSIETGLPIFDYAPTPGLADPVCAIGNAFGLGLSVTCGVVSALGVTTAGFNPVEDFVQTDAAVNPGASGGALVDTNGRLVGMLSAIFASDGDGSIGVNFAVSADLLARVADSLMSDGEVAYKSAGWRLQQAPLAAMADSPAPVVVGLDPGSVADRAGLAIRDRIARIGSKHIQSPRDAVTALALLGPDDKDVAVDVLRDGMLFQARLRFETAAPLEEATPNPEVSGDCPHPEPVCDMRQAVFPVTSFDPLGSATRIGEDLLVTNRHVVGDREDAIVHTPDGPRRARVVPSGYPGDLALLQVDNLPEQGVVAHLENADPIGTLTSIGADLAQKEIRVFDAGDVLSAPSADAPLGRWHVSAKMQPGVSGGALVDSTGQLIGIATGGGDGRYEAIPVANVVELLALRDDPNAATIQRQLGASLVACDEALQTGPSPRLSQVCQEANNAGQLLDAGRIFAQDGQFDEAVALHTQAVAQVPNSINARVSLLVSLQLAARFEDMLPHARRVLELAPDDPQTLRFAIQSGVWGGDPGLAEAGYAALLEADPRQAEAARRFIDASPPAPQR